MAILISDMDCQKCSDGVKELRGCEKETMPYLIDGEEYTKCPVKCITGETRLYLRTYSAMKLLGCLYCDGGLEAQPAKLVDTISIINSAINKYHENAIKHARGK